MGTNYYLTNNCCEKCGRGDAPLHIGKSSGGWRFGLHVMPEDGIHDLADWEARWSLPGATIKDEYGDPITPTEMRAIITERTWRDGLRGHQIDGRYCIGHGEGTWDLLPGEFS